MKPNDKKQTSRWDQHPLDLNPTQDQENQSQKKQVPLVTIKAGNTMLQLFHGTNLWIKEENGATTLISMKTVIEMLTNFAAKSSSPAKNKDPQKDAKVEKDQISKLQTRGQKRSSSPKSGSSLHGDQKPISKPQVNSQKSPRVSQQQPASTTSNNNTPTNISNPITTVPKSKPSVAASSEVSKPLQWGNYHFFG